MIGQVIHGKTFEYEAANFCGTLRYSIEQRDANRFDEIIPDNIFSLDRAAMTPIVKGVMERMNVLWSSTGGVASFPEKFGEHTKLSIHSDRIYMSGQGWSFSIWNGSREVLMSKRVRFMREIMQNESMTFEEKAEALAELNGRLATKIGD